MAKSIVVVDEAPSWQRDFGEFRGNLRQETLEALAEGIKAHGDSVIPVSELGWDNPWMADGIVSWGVRGCDVVAIRAPRHIVVEVGFLGDRSKNFYVGLNRLNHDGRLPGDPIQGRGEPWYGEILDRKPREHKRAVILGQLAGDTSLYPITAGTNQIHGGAAMYAAWLKNMASLCQYHGLEVGWRAHPRAVAKGDTTKPDVPGVLDLDEMGWTKEAVWEWADVAVAFSSNSLVEAYLAGVDVIPGHPTSMAWDVRSYFHEPREKTELEKRQWLDKVASFQWSMEEMRSGKMWGYVSSGF